MTQTAQADTATNAKHAATQLAPGEVVIVRDAEWLVTNTEPTTSGTLVRCIGLSELVRDTTGAFYTDLDEIIPLNTREAKLIGDDSSQYRTARLWLEATLRRQPIPTSEPRLTVSTHMLADPLQYQLTAVKRAFDQEQLRPRLLIADAVGLGKTIEIGMILSELVRRGEGERILIVTPKHVLEQMQRELWTRFALPFVRLDSIGLQRVRQQLPATRNPFSYFKRAIISIDTLKQDQYRAHLQKFHWDAVVIDESHNITGATLNNRLAHTLAPNTHALILASATPHNGKAESFAELIRLLEPSAVRPDGTVDRKAVQRLVLRRHRHSPEVRTEVGADWAERKEPLNLRIPATDAENRLAEHLATTWLKPQGQGGQAPSPYSGENKGLFPWTLAKAFLSSPVALAETVRERGKRLGRSPAEEREKRALDELGALAQDALAEGSAKLAALETYLESIGIGHHKDQRAVVFSERVATLNWLHNELKQRFKLSADEIRVLHGGLSDVEQQEIVDEFRKASSKLRVLITGDVASEGVNLHSQCHELIHFDIPWSLIRIEQRNGRIDRYGQRTPPQITTLLLDFDNELFKGDANVLARLIEREDEAHRALGDTASLMGKYNAKAEEDEIRSVLSGTKSLDDVVASPEEVLASDDVDDPFLAFLVDVANCGKGQVAEAQDAGPQDAGPGTDASGQVGETQDTQAVHGQWTVGQDAQARTDDIPAPGLFRDSGEFLRTGLETAYPVPGESLEHNGVGFRESTTNFTMALTPPRDLNHRLRVLPQSYLAERHVTEQFTTTTSKDVAKRSLNDAQNSVTSPSLWPAEHYLGPLHPMLDWVADKTLTSLGRNEVFAVRGNVDEPTVYLLATISDRQARTVAAMHLTQTQFGDDSSMLITGVHPEANAALSTLGLTAENQLVNPGAVDTAPLEGLITAAVDQSEVYARGHFQGIADAVEERVQRWLERVAEWEQDADALAQRRVLRERKSEISEEAQLAESMRPHHLSVRPLLVVVPVDWPVGSSGPLSSEGSLSSREAAYRNANEENEEAR
ncbi:helicase-related protein [Gulosibacter molinativorax]|uniref:ATP-dependent helicase n=1 Tax=Gulosibacter molinativorax TaxID=256821 RepID=A0ABT7C3W1_9MICO|nr:helicase-related protein [Gulosibacter molinativorax]MDJ1369932.1 ATP-dependent helicase [Gulosibacter molinativorax]QUY61903.1 Helicase [Gulosibacter molinativorax]